MQKNRHQIRIGHSIVDFAGSRPSVPFEDFVLHVGHNLKPVLALNVRRQRELLRSGIGLPGDETTVIYKFSHRDISGGIADFSQDHFVAPLPRCIEIALIQDGPGHVDLAAFKHFHGNLNIGHHEIRRGAERHIHRRGRYPFVVTPEDKLEYSPTPTRRFDDHIHRTAQRIRQDQIGNSFIASVRLQRAAMVECSIVLYDAIPLRIPGEIHPIEPCALARVADALIGNGPTHAH